MNQREFVGKTAQLMAAIRAMEHERKEGLFTDPFAAKLAGSEGFAMLEQLLPRDRAYILVRTRFFDDFIMETVNADLNQPWEHLLLEKGYQVTIPSVFLVEGLFLYLEEAQVHSLMQRISKLTAPGSHLGLDLLDRGALKTPQGLVQKTLKDEPPVVTGKSSA
ncbi:class I SAM-dependent methyltransferase [Limnofasciculus baicalensis]|uniref:Class I SAM-dependent methyltransferase n=1 Tax=Limnofasciculus baicalensis BBK-W-15 TaxID=2699891 RepID=A0AAE3KM18_9CYAN|nr:class I SAM-dependent methyltransferase [Limnofasciculus baicalensis]MCP2728729.1 class I SAM-dependent methyltransferase [Limnofasciculus baicalensis BBK-W-15]